MAIMIQLDVAKRSIELLVDAAELERKARCLEPAAAPDEAKRGYAWLFDKTIMQADEGCDFDSCRDWAKRLSRKAERG